MERINLGKKKIIKNEFLKTRSILGLIVNVRYICDQCEYSTTHLYMLKRHLKIVHEGRNSSNIKYRVS